MRVIKNILQVMPAYHGIGSLKAQDALYMYVD